jgi:hypothetical protein
MKRSAQELLRRAGHAALIATMLGITAPIMASAADPKLTEEQRTPSAWMPMSISTGRWNPPPIVKAQSANALSAR